MGFLSVNFYIFNDNTVYFEQARIVVICKKIYCQKIEPECFIDKSIIDKWYDDDYHYAYVGQIEKVLKEAGASLKKDRCRVYVF